MKVTVTDRTETSKGAVKRARRAGKIPAVFYKAGGAARSIFVEGAEFHAALRAIESNHLSVTVFEIAIDGELYKTIVKEIQYDRVTYDVIHLDFAALEAHRSVRLNVPIVCKGEADCVGIKLGGNLRQVIRSVKVECLPEHIPHEFVLDVSELKVKESKRLSDIVMSEGVKSVGKVDEVVVIIAKR